MTLLSEMECLYQAAKDRRQNAIGQPSEGYYKGQVAAYGRAIVLIRKDSQPKDLAVSLSESMFYECPNCQAIHRLQSEAEECCR